MRPANDTGNTSAGAGTSTDVPESAMLGLFAAALIPLALRRGATRKAVWTSGPILTFASLWGKRRSKCQIVQDH